MKYLTLLLLFPLITYSQKDTLFYSTGELMNVSYFDSLDNKVSKSYFYKSGQLKGESYYDKYGTLKDGYTLNKNGDTIRKSNIPLFKAQVPKDLSKKKWKKRKGGISISIEEKGSGKKFKKGDEVVIWYIGYFIDGSQFDNSNITKYELDFSLGSGRMLKSFESGVYNFKPGSSGYIRIPPGLAYGSKATGNIPPNSTLIYYIKPVRK